MQNNKQAGNPPYTTFKSVTVDLDGTLLHAESEHIPVKGKSGFCYLAKTSADLLSKISRLCPVVIATGRNASSVEKLIVQVPYIRFAGFVLENGFVIKEFLQGGNVQENRWDFIIDHLPGWKRLPGYENCLCLIPPKAQFNPEKVVKEILTNMGDEGYVYSEYRKIFIYPEAPNKMIGLSKLKAHPYISLGNDLNDLQVMRNSFYPVTLHTACDKIKDAVKEKNGYCSALSSHAAAADMLAWTYSKLQSCLS